MNRLWLADISSNAELSAVFGTYNSISNVGFIIGPTFGGILFSTPNGFFKVSLLSSSIFLLNAFLVYFFIPEKKVITDVKPSKQISSINFIHNFKSIPWGLVWDIFTVRFLQTFAMILFRSNFTSVLVFRFEIDARTTGYIQSFNGVISASTGMLVQWIVPYFSSTIKCHNVFSLVLIFSLLGVTLGPSLSFVLLSFVPLCISSAVLRVTSSTSLFSRGGSKVRGLMNGIADTLASFARALGPAIGGYTQEISVYGPGISGTLLAVAGTAVSMYADFHLSHLHSD